MFALWLFCRFHKVSILDNNILVLSCTIIDNVPHVKPLAKLSRARYSEKNHCYFVDEPHLCSDIVLLFDGFTIRLVGIKQQ
jgi:hypothetical protein